MRLYALRSPTKALVLIKPTSFDQTKEETTCYQTTIALTNASESSDDAPRNRYERNPSRWSHILLQDDIARQLRKNVCDEQNRDCCLVLISHEAKVFFQAVEASIANVHPEIILTPFDGLRVPRGYVPIKK